MNFLKVLALLDDFLTRQQHRYVVVGAFAMHAYGMTRATADLDLAVDTAAQPALLPHLEALGYQTLHASAGYSTHIHPLGRLGRLDFLYLARETADTVFAAAQRSLELEGRVFPVPRVEHLAAMKAFAMKNAPERSLQEMADVLQMLQLPGVDRREIQTYFRTYGLEEKFDELLQRLPPDRP
jgi:hypothetical protein